MQKGKEKMLEGRQAEKLRMCDADELAYRIILFAKPAGNNSTYICQVFILLPGSTCLFLSKQTNNSV